MTYSHQQLVEIWNSSTPDSTSTHEFFWQLSTWLVSSPRSQRSCIFRISVQFEKESFFLFSCCLKEADSFEDFFSLKVFVHAFWCVMRLLPKCPLTWILQESSIRCSCMTCNSQIRNRCLLASTVKVRRLLEKFCRLIYFVKFELRDQNKAFNLELKQLQASSLVKDTVRQGRKK